MYQVGDNFWLKVWGATPYAGIYWSDPRMGPDKYLAGYANGNGDFSLYSTPSLVDVGLWSMTWYAGGLEPADPHPLRFFVTTFQDEAIVPPFFTYPWNYDAYIREWNNCYNYGANTITNSFAQPGRWALGHFCPLGEPCVNVNEFRLRLLYDSFIEASPAGYGGVDAICAAGTAKFALFIAPGIDFHFFRQDADGWWSHKPGSSSVRWYDNDLNSIYNPMYANRGIYWQPGGIFCVPHSSKLQGESAATIW